MGFLLCLHQMCFKMISVKDTGPGTSLKLTPSVSVVKVRGQDPALADTAQ